VEFTARYQRKSGQPSAVPVCFSLHRIAIAACRQAPERSCRRFEIRPSSQKPTRSSSRQQPQQVFHEEKKEQQEKSAQASQWPSCKRMHVPDNEISNFRDGEALAGLLSADCSGGLKLFGLSADFRRSFITTDANPFYDSFVRWQFNTLKKAAKVKIRFTQHNLLASEKQPAPTTTARKAKD